MTNIEFEEIEKIIITYLSEGLTQKEMRIFFKEKRIRPNSQSGLEKRIAAIKKKVGAKSYFQLGLIVAKMDKKLFVPAEKIEFPLSGTFCPKCNDDMEIRANMFYWRGKYFSGLVCAYCNSLYDNPADSFKKYVGIKK